MSSDNVMPSRLVKSYFFSIIAVIVDNIKKPVKL